MTDLLPATELALAACALAAALLLRPWRLLAGPDAPLATPLLACAVLLPWLWAWPGLFQMPMPLQWSGAHLAVLLLGWPLAVLLLAGAALSTIATAGADLAQAVGMFTWHGLLPATLALVLGHAVRQASGQHPLAYVVGRGFLIPLASLWACTWAGAAAHRTLMAALAQDRGVALLLMASGEAMATGMLVAMLVAFRPQWLATWSDRLYLRPAPPRRR